jgi:hydrogenase maturation protease
MRTLVLGLGNPILGDDGIGVRVAEAVAAALPAAMAVEVDEACAGGLELMERMAGYDRVVLIDALCRGDAAPGTLRRLTLAELDAISPTQHSASAHDATLMTAMAAGRRVGLDLPDMLTVYAIEIERVLDFGEVLSPAVAAALPGAVEAVLAEIGCPAETPQPEAERRRP